MVSLSQNYNTNSGGAIFFSESVNMADSEPLLPTLEFFGTIGTFQSLKTCPLFSLHLVFTVLLDVLAIVYAASHPDTASRCREYFVIIYLHVAFWFFTLLLHMLTKHMHNKIRLMGYLDFYKNVECHGSLPLIVVSLWSVALLFVQTLMQHYYPDDFEQKCLKGGSFSPKGYICALITVEFCLLFGINISYMMKVIKFNKQRPPPDVLKNEWLSSGNPEAVTQNEVGYHEIGSKVYDFLEKQADLIQYLSEHNVKLREKVMQLSLQGKNENPEASSSIEA